MARRSGRGGRGEGRRHLRSLGLITFTLTLVGLVVVAILALSTTGSDPDGPAHSARTGTATASPAASAAATPAAATPATDDHDADDRGDDDDGHPVRTQTVPGDRPTVQSPFSPINADTLTHVPKGWLVRDRSLRSGGRLRTYLMIRPPTTVPGTLPVIMVLHGRRLTPADIERITRLIPVAGRAVYVYPAGYGRSWNAGGCCGIAHAAGVDDVAFLEQVLHQVLTTEHDASARRVYLMGFSNGGRMAYRMACQDPGAFAGVAAVEAVPVSDCNRLSPVPVAIVAQTGDPLLTVARDGHRKSMDGYLEPTVTATVADWRTIDDCRAATLVRHVGDATVTRYQGCSGRGRLEYDLYRGGRHAWPEGNRTTPSASRFIWSYFDHDVLPPSRQPLTVAAPVPAVPAVPAVQAGAAQAAVRAVLTEPSTRTVALPARSSRLAATAAR